MAITRRTVTIKADDFPGEFLNKEASVTFCLPCDLNLDDGTILKAGERTVTVPGSVDLPVYDGSTVTQDGFADWYITVTKSWHRSHPYRIQVPAGSGSIPLGKIPALRPLKRQEATYALTSASVRTAPSPDGAWGGSGVVTGSNLALTLLVPDSAGGGSTGRSEVNVLSYGAAANGTTDDTEAIRKAANAAGQHGTVIFPKGTYLMSSNVTMPTGQLWLGSGGMANMPSGAVTIISTVSGAPTITASHGALQGFHLNGPGDQSNTNAIYAEGQIALRDVNTFNFGRGVHMLKVWYSHLERVFQRYCGVGYQIDNCYNVTIQTPRIHARSMDSNRWGKGIVMTGASMIKLFGGSIEQYSTGVEMGDSLTAGNNMHALLSGVYMETYSPKAWGVKMSGTASSVTATGCEVYLDNHEAWINAGGYGAGDCLVAEGNHFKASNNAASTTYAYLLNGAGTLQSSLGVDSWGGVGNKTGYRYANLDKANGGQIIVPIGATIG